MFSFDAALRTLFKHRRLRKLYAARDAAQAQYDNAVTRGDTRAQHEAVKRLQRAVMDCLKGEK